jgi:hypothetical protein
MATKAPVKECSTHGEYFADTPESECPACQDSPFSRWAVIDGVIVPADSIEIVYGGVYIPGEDESGSLHINLTHEGLIMDVWGKDKEGNETNFGTSSETAEEITERLCEENS